MVQQLDHVHNGVIKISLSWILLLSELTLFVVVVMVVGVVFPDVFLASFSLLSHALPDMLRQSVFLLFFVLGSLLMLLSLMVLLVLTKVKEGVPVTPLYSLLG